MQAKTNKWDGKTLITHWDQTPSKNAIFLGDLTPTNFPPNKKNIPPSIFLKKQKVSKAPRG